MCRSRLTRNIHPGISPRSASAAQRLPGSKPVYFEVDEEVPCAAEVGGEFKAAEGGMNVEGRLTVGITCEPWVKEPVRASDTCVEGADWGMSVCSVIA